MNLLTYFLSRKIKVSKLNIFVGNVIDSWDHCITSLIYELQRHGISFNISAFDLEQDLMMIWTLI